MKKKMLSLFMTGAMLTGILSGCGSADKATENQENNVEESIKKKETEETNMKPAGDVILEWEVTATSEKIPILQEIAADFTAQTGIEIELVTPGNDYETVMKTRMASGDLPDIWETHGWSVARYSEYLLPLNEQEWFGRVDESILPIITDESGNIYCLPLTVGLNTISYNKDVFKAAGVEPSEIRTWDDFNEACEKIKEIGIDPIFCGDKDSSTIAQLCESIPPSFLTLECVEDNQAAALKNGSFHFAEKWTPIAELVDGWMQNKYFNEDILTSDNEAACQALGNGECAMVFGGSNNILFARTYNPEANIGYLACPGVNEDDTNFLSMGEGTCIGIWKDSENLEQSKQFLNYLSQAEVCEKIATASGDIPGLKDVSNEDAYITQAFRETQKSFEGDIEYVPLFDREYLPSGMWDDLGVAMTNIIMNPGKAIEESTSYLQEAYNNKMAQ